MPTEEDPIHEQKGSLNKWNKSQLFKLLHGLYHTKIPTMIWGNPGVGKTSTVKFLGERLGKPTEIRSGNKSDPTDFSGIPYLIDVEGEDGVKTKTLKFSEPKYVQMMKDNPNGILFFDEITTCSPVIQVALLSIIQDCQFGEFEIPKTIYRVAAGNYNNITGTHNMSLALMNRFCHIFYDMDFNFFTDGFISKFKNYEKAKINETEEQIIKEKENKYRLAVVNFIKEHPEFLDAFPADGAISDPHEFAYPTPRSWEMVVKILSVLDENVPEYIEELVKGCIGDAACKLFIEFIKNYKGLEIDIPGLVGKEKEFRLPHPDRHDHVSQIMASVVFYLEHDPKKYIELWKQVISVLHNASYDSLIMKYLYSNIQHLLDSKTLDPKDLREFSKHIPCWELLQITALDKFSNKDR
jgi:MoxR-like ATPase